MVARLLLSGPLRRPPVVLGNLASSPLKLGGLLEVFLFARCLHPATTEATLESHDIHQRTANTVFLSCITRAMAMSGIPKIVRVHYVFPVG